MRRVGLVFTGPLARLNDMVEMVRRAEELDFSSAWQAEDPGGPDAVSLLASYAHVTRQVRLGTAITPPYARHPALLASTFAALDDLSGGRTVLGLGAGTLWWDRLTLARDSLRPVRDMAETVRVFRALLDQGEAEVRGQRIELRHGFPWNADPLPPLVRRSIPVYIGAQRPQMIRLAGQLADGLIIEISPVVTTAAERVQAVRAAAQAAGRDPDSLDIVALAMMGVTPDGAVDSTVLSRWVAPRLTRLDDAQAEARGFEPDRMARLRQAVAEGRLDDAAQLLTPAMIAACGAFGTPDACLAWLDDLAAVGVREPILFPVAGDPALTLEVGAMFARR